MSGPMTPERRAEIRALGLLTDITYTDKAGKYRRAARDLLAELERVEVERDEARGWATLVETRTAQMEAERERAEQLEKLLVLAMWMGGTDERSLRTLLADAEAGEGTYMPSAARVVLAEATVSSERVSL